MKRFFLLAIAIILASSTEANAQSFTARLGNGDQLFFRITDTTSKSVEIFRLKAVGKVQYALPSGDLVIPSTVRFKNTKYDVISIGESVFAGAEGLTSVSIPSSVRKIGDKAFSGCTNLESIVFPSRTPSMGVGVFEKCKSLSSITFGSDWDTVDFQMFADAEALKEVYVPSRVIKIRGLKTLAYLEKIEVDANNRAFSSHDGILYSKDGVTLYACPQAKRGDVSIIGGTEKILDGAFRDCEKVTSILLPSSINEFAYDEFSDCRALNNLVLLSEVPPMTAKWNGSSVFAVKAPNEKCLILVAKANLKHYQISICSSAGTYETLEGNRKTVIESSEMIAESAVKKMKKNR